MSKLVAVVHSKIERILDFLEADQLPDGEFPALRYFHGIPDGNTVPSEIPGWYKFGKCPFFTATILYHLAGFEGLRVELLRKRACDWLLGTFESGLIRYVPARYQEVWFPADIDDTCLVRRVLVDQGVSPPGDDEIILRNRDGDGRFYTWFIPRWRHLGSPRDVVWLTRDFARWSWRLFKQDARNATRLVAEYHSTREPAVDANVLLYFRDDPRVQYLGARLVESLRARHVRLEYYDSMIGPYFHAARTYHDGAQSLEVLRSEIHDHILAVQSDSGCVQTGFDTAMSALTLMYFGYWDSKALSRAMSYLANDPMHEHGWLPIPYVNPVNRAFSDGAPALTAVLYADALRRYADHVVSAT